MITEVAKLLKVSDSNPVQFWPAPIPTFNQRRIALLSDKRYTQRFNFADRLRLDFLFNTAYYADWDIGTAYVIGNRVYDPASGTRWKAKTNNTGHQPSLDSTFTNWQHDGIVDADVWSDVFEYALGDRVLYQNLTSVVLNPDFAGSLTDWTNAGSGQTWTYDGVSGGAKISFHSDAAHDSSKRLTQSLSATDTLDNYLVRLTGVITVDDWTDDPIIIKCTIRNAADAIIATANLVHTEPSSGDGSFDVSVVMNAPAADHVAFECVVSEDIAGSCIFTLADVSLASSGNYKVYQSLTDANLGNPVSDATYWEQVTEATGHFVLRGYVNNVIVETIDFANIDTSTHQFIQFLFSDYSDFEDALVRFDAYDVQAAAIVANADCLGIVTEMQPSVRINYTNTSDFDFIDYSDMPVFQFRIEAHFYEESVVREVENHILSSGDIVSLRGQLTTKRLLNIIEYVQDFIHKKINKILLHDTVSITVYDLDGSFIEELYWKCQDEYQKDVPETSTLSRAQVLLTESDSVLVNIGGDTGTSSIPADGGDSSEFLTLAELYDLGIWIDRGPWDASTNLMPSVGGTGAGGVIKKGNTFDSGLTVSTTLLSPDGNTVLPGTIVRALVDSPGNDITKWAWSYRLTA